MRESLLPPDEIADWAIVAAQLLASMRLEPHDTTLVSAALTGSLVDAYQVAVCLARVVGELLRPGGWDWGPIGLEAARSVLDRVGDDPATPHPDYEPDALAAARMIAYAANGDAGMVRSLALAVCATRRPVTHLRQVVRCMLEVLAVEPQHEPTTEGTPDDERP